MSNVTIKFIAKSAIIAGLYVALTWVLAPISYGQIQFRLSEVLILIAVFNYKYIPGLIIGCFISNIPSSLGWYDMVFGTLATTIALVPMIWVKKLPIASIFPVLSNAFIVAFELCLAFDTMFIDVYFLNVLTVGLGEAVVLFFVGIPLWIGITKNSAIVELLELNVKENNYFKKFRIAHAIAIALGVTGIILFVAYPMYQAKSVDGELINTTMLDFVIEGNYIPIITIVLSVLFTISVFVLKNKIKLIVSIIIALLFFYPLIMLAIQYDYVIMCPYYYGYLVYIALLVIASVVDYTRTKKSKIEEVSNDELMHE